MAAELSSIGEPSDPEFPRSFGDYELIAEIARGSMGVVYEAHDRLANRRVALKTMLAGQREDQVRVERFLREARQAAALHHENVVCVYRVGELEQQPYFTMALVDGENLEDVAADGSLPPRRVAEIGLSIARALEAAHAQGLVHRDIKPGNILIDATGTVLVTDFGVAKMIDDDSTLTIDGEVFGSPSYMAPEQAMPSGYAEIGPAADVYGVGAVLYRLLAGRPPFVGSTAVGTMKLVLEQEPVALDRIAPGVPAALATIIHQCLQKTPKRRYRDGGHLAADLQRFLAGEPVEARPVGRLVRLGLWARRRPFEATLAAALVLALVVGISGIVWGWVDAAAALQRARESRLGALTTARATELPLLWEQVQGDEDGLRDLIANADEPRVRLRAAVALLGADRQATEPIAELIPQVSESPVEIAMATRQLRKAWSGLPESIRQRVLERLRAPIERTTALGAIAKVGQESAVGQAGAASAVLAALAPEQLDAHPAVADRLVEMLMRARPDQLRVWRRLSIKLPNRKLRELVEEARLPLDQLAATATEGSRRRRAAALAVSFAGDPDIAGDVLLHASPERLLELLREARLALRRADLEVEPFWRHVREVGLAPPVGERAPREPVAGPAGADAKSLEATARELDPYGGAVGGWGAFVPRAPANLVRRWAESLAAVGCHLVRARLVDAAGGVAAVWRFGAPEAEWRVDLGTPELQAEDARYRARGMGLIDLSVVRGMASAVWARSRPGQPTDASVEVGVGVERLYHVMRSISRFSTPVSSVVYGEPAAEHFCVVWRRVAEPPLTRSLLGVPLAEVDQGLLPGYCLRDFSLRIRDGQPVLDGLWVVEPAAETRVVAADDPLTHRREALALARSGWVPTSIHAASLAGADGSVATVWRRSLPTAEDSFGQQEQRLRALVMLLAEGELDTAKAVLARDPSLTWRSRVLARLPSFGLSVRCFVDWLARIEDPRLRRVVLGVCRRVGLGSLSEDERSAWVAARRAELVSCPDRGLRAMLEWVLTGVGSGDSSSPTSPTPTPPPAAGVRSSELRTASGERMLVFEPAEFWFGAHGRQPGRAAESTPFRVELRRRFALAERETTNESMREFFRQWPIFRNRKLGSPKTAAAGVTWLQAVAYCRWLSEQEGVPESEQCYPPLEVLRKRKFTVAEGALDRTGYRLPSEAEWEFAVRGHEMTRFSFGDDVAFFHDLAWGPRNTYTVREGGLFPPSESGLYDCEGNAMEWCHEAFQRTNWRPTEYVGFQPFDLEGGASFRVDEDTVCAMRGGSFGVMPSHQSATRRSAYLATGLAQGTGFRLARTLR